MTRLRLYKKDKLCSKTAIDRLFDPSRKKEGLTRSVMAYPWRAVWQINNVRTLARPQFLITVPKKRLRHAVDRVTMRRRLREAFRLSHQQLLPADIPLDIAFIYVADSLTDYHAAKRSMTKILTRIAASAEQTHADVAQFQPDPHPHKS